MAKLIDLMIVGAQKSATTSLMHYLAEHPQIQLHVKTEFGFFVDDNEYAAGYESVFSSYFPNADLSQNTILMAKNVGVLSSPTAIQRLYKHNPLVEVIVVLRSPIDRAYSAFWFAKKRGWETLASFDEAISCAETRTFDDEVVRRNCAYLERGHYIEQIQALYETFPANKIHILLLSDLRKNPITLCQKIFRLFDNIDAGFSPSINQKHNQSAMSRSRWLARMTSHSEKQPLFFTLLRKLFPNQLLVKIRKQIRKLNEHEFSPPPMNLETRAWLIDYFRPFNDELSQLIGRDLTHWNN